MGIGRMRSIRRWQFVGLICVIAVFAALAGACTQSPATERPAPASGKQEGPAKPQASANWCVACHTSRENIKSTAAPPPPVVKSAEQAGEG